MSVPRVRVPPHLLIIVPVRGSVPAETVVSEAWWGGHGRNVGSVCVTCVLVLTGGGCPWCSAVDSGTDAALSSGRHGVGEGCTWNVPGCRAFG